MSWTIVRFGKYKDKNKTLPQIVFLDPDWFFWAIENYAFNNKGSLTYEAQDINRKARRIRIPQNGGEKQVAEYVMHQPSGKFAYMALVPSTSPEHHGSAETYRLEYIDLSFPRIKSKYDKSGCSLIISNLKFIYFGNRSYKMTKKRCEDFFENNENFIL